MVGYQVSRCWEGAVLSRCATHLRARIRCWACYNRLKTVSFPEPVAEIRKAFSEAGLGAPVGKELSFELRPVDDQAAVTEDIAMPTRDDKPLH